MPEDSDDDNLGPIPYHYAWSKDLHELFSKQNSKHNSRMHFCERCLHGYHSPAKFEAQDVNCSQLNERRITMPKIYFDEYWSSRTVDTRPKSRLWCTLTSKASSRGYQPWTREQPKGVLKITSPPVARSVSSAPSTQLSEFKISRSGSGNMACRTTSETGQKWRIVNNRVFIQ